MRQYAPCVDSKPFSWRNVWKEHSNTNPTTVIPAVTRWWPRLTWRKKCQIREVKTHIQIKHKKTACVAFLILRNMRTMLRDDYMDVLLSSSLLSPGLLHPHLPRLFLLFTMGSVNSDICHLWWYELEAHTQLPGLELLFNSLQNKSFDF